jgi:uncharacterized membrane protein YfcA
MLTNILIALIFLAAGFVQGISGFGSALVAMPLLALLVDVKVAVPLCMLNGLLITLFLCLQLKAHIDWKKIAPLTLGCIPGIYVGVTILKRADDSVIRLALGALLIAYALYCLTLSKTTRIIRPGWAYLAGFLTGAIGGAFSAGGPPTIIYTTHTGWSKEQIKATLSGFFLLTGICIAAAHAWTGLTTKTVLTYSAISAVPVLCGVALGSVCYGRFDRRTYLRAIYLLLLAMGGLMITSVF